MFFITGKRGQELICQGSYEKRAVEWLNENKTEFEWQPKVFETPLISERGNIRTYRPDLYLIEEDKWIEIKGWLNRNPISRQKWDWFHQTHINSELWNEDRIKKLNISGKQKHAS